MYEAGEDGEDAVEGLVALFKFEVFVPERMRKEVEADAVCSSLEETVRILSVCSSI